MLLQVWTIGRNTYTESIRQPIFVVLTLLGSLVLVLGPSFAAYTLDDDNRIMINMGLSTLFVAGLLLAAFTATNVLSREVENKTVLTVVSKPVSRPIFIFGKYMGVSTAIGMAFTILTLVFLLTVRHKVMQTASDKFDIPVWVFGMGGALAALALATLGNYFYHWVFTSTFMVSLFGFMTAGWAIVLVVSKDWHFQSPVTDLDGQLLIGLLLVLTAVLILTSVAVTASTRTGQVMTILICLIVFCVGLMSQYFFGLYGEEYLIVNILYRIMPNMQFLWPADALTNENDFSFRYVLSVMGYSILMIGAILSLGVALFQTREVG